MGPLYGEVGQPPPPPGLPPRSARRSARRGSSGLSNNAIDQERVVYQPEYQQYSQISAPLPSRGGSSRHQVSRPRERSRDRFPSADRPLSRDPGSLQDDEDGGRAAYPSSSQGPSGRLEHSGELDDYEEEYDEEPATEEEVRSMAIHLGMDPVRDAPLLWIAAEAFDAPLPEGWSEHFDWDGKVYFYNRNQDLVVRDHPLDDFYRELFKVVKSKGSSVSDGDARAYAAAQAAALAQAAAFGQKTSTRNKDRAAGAPAQVGAKESRSREDYGSQRASGAAPAEPAGSSATQKRGGEDRSSSLSSSMERMFVESTMSFMQNIVEVMGKNQMENTAMQAQMQAELLRQIQSGGQKDSAASAQREVLLKLESKLSSLQDVQHRELAHIKALESMHREELNKLNQQASHAAGEAARLAAMANDGAQGVAQELIKQQALLDEYRRDLQDRIATVMAEQSAAVDAAKAKARGELSAVQMDLQSMVGTLKDAGDIVDSDVLEAMSSAARGVPTGGGSKASEGPALAAATTTALSLLQEKLTHAERMASEANAQVMNEKLARMNSDMEESLRERIRALEAEHEVEVDRLKERIAQAEREAQAARDEIKWEKENSEKMLQTAMQMAAAAGSRASEESSVRLSELQEKLSAKEREVVEANAALQREKDRLSVQEEATARVEAMLQEMKHGASSFDGRLKQFDDLLKAKEAEKATLLEEVSGLRATVAASKNSANEAALAAHQAAMAQVAKLNGDLEAERARGAMELQRRDHDHAKALQEERSNGRISKAARRTMGRMQDETKELKKAYRSVRDEQKSFMLYAFNKMAEASAALESMATMLGREKYLRERLESAVRECDQRMAPLVAEKRRLFNELLTAKGNIRVFCRVRPFSSKERAAGIDEAFDFPDAGSDADGCSGRFIMTLGKEKGVQRKQYEFDKVFPPSTSQEEAYSAVQPLIQSVMDGYNVCVFAYGQTGSGKTHTMEGPPDDRGITYRAFDELFRMARAVWGAYEYTFTVHLLEVYNESIRDLLVKKGTDNERHDIKTDENDAVFVTNISHESVSTPEDFVALMKRGTSNRSTGATNMNERSSRSHLIMGINVTCRNLVNGKVKRSKLSLVDLAGSERVGKSGAEGDRLKEAMHINKSLSALGDVISSLTSKRSHTPFRNSKLTHILSDSLGNDSKTLLLVACSPAQSNAHESSCSLNFAQRARNVDLGQGAGSSAVKRLKEASAVASKEHGAQIRQLEEELARAQEIAAKAEKEGSRSRSHNSEDAAVILAELKEAKKQLAASQGAVERLKYDNDHKAAAIKELQSRAEEAQAMAAGRSSRPGSSRPSPEQSSRIRFLEEKLAQRDAELAETRAQLQRGGLSRQNSSGFGNRPGSALRMQAALDAAMEAAHSASANDAQTSKLRSQLSELTEINKTLLEKCKCVKADKAELEKQLQERDGALKLLEAKYRLLVKKFAPSGGSNTALPHQALAPLVYEL